MRRSVQTWHVRVSNIGATGERSGPYYFTSARCVHGRTAIRRAVKEARVRWSHWSDAVLRAEATTNREEW
jgi:hypothetical protein